MPKKLFKNVQSGLIALASCAIVFGVIYTAFNFSKAASIEDKVNERINIIRTGEIIYDNDLSSDWVESPGWTVTSYGDVNEALYSGNKIRIFDKNNNFLGLYRTDFLEKVIINGAGVGDGIGNNREKFLHYDYDIDDKKTCYLSDFSLGAYNNELVPWTENIPSIAINPAMPYGTKVKFKSLGTDEDLIPQWVREILSSKTFYVGDKFYGFGNQEKKIDVYVGLIESKDYGEQSLYIKNATVLINPQMQF